MNTFWKWIGASFDTNTIGASARKLSAFVLMCCVVTAHIAWLKKAFMENDFSLLKTILVTDYTFIAALLAMTTYSATRDQKKDGDDNQPKNEGQ